MRVRKDLLKKQILLSSLQEEHHGLINEVILES